MKKILLASTVLIATFFTACSTVKVKSEDTSSLMKYDGTNTDYSKLDSYKKATICKEFVVGKGYIGSNSVAEAAKNGGISKVNMLIFIVNTQSKVDFFHQLEITLSSVLLFMVNNL